MYPYFERPFAKSYCSFQKDFNAQHCLNIMMVKQRKAVDEGGQEHPLLTDLSKTFNCIDHESLIAKLYPYGFAKILCTLLICISRYRNEEPKQITFTVRLSRFFLV